MSVIVRARDCGDHHAPSDDAVARLITATGIQPLADWLTGFASVIVPERGTFLVSGLVGALLAGDHLVDDDTAEHSAIAAVLERFGFNADEACYIESRLFAGSFCVSVTTSSADEKQRAALAFSGESAVYIPRARTHQSILRSASRLLVSPPETSTGGDVVVTDAVARFFRYCDSGRASREYLTLRGRTVVDRDGRDIGSIAEFIAETLLDQDNRSEHDEVRYAIVAFGGVLGIRRHYTAIPIDKIDLIGGTAHVGISRDMFRHAPGYDPHAPFSRREELAICDYFGMEPYWMDATG